MSWLEGVLDHHPRLLYLIEHVWDEGLIWMSGVCLLALAVIVLV